MSLPWESRKARLGHILKSHGDEDEDAFALDRILHEHNGSRRKGAEVENLRFQDRDLQVVGTLEYGQFGVIDVVTCTLDGRFYVCKSVQKLFALRMRHQCSPQFERDILLRARKSKSRWAPHLLCAFQTPTHLNLVMDYAEGGTLWDVLESSPDGGRVSESDLSWWAPQAVSAIHWCHSQGFAHRDIKPHNFVLTANAHLLLIDFGSAAPLLPPRQDGSRSLEKRHCLVLCGTCDYISPEILRAHEDALVALEMDDDDDDYQDKKARKSQPEVEGYGLETDWWSLGAMLYEMAYGVAPFFANDIRQTYLRIMNHKQSLRFDRSVPVSGAFEDLLSRLLTNHEGRIGRNDARELMDHPFFASVNWRALPDQLAPQGLRLPRFTYTEAAVPAQVESKSQSDSSYSQGFAFSAFFQSFQDTAIHATPQKLSQLSDNDDPASAFVGFSWGPPLDAFSHQNRESAEQVRHVSLADLATPRPNKISFSPFTPKPLLMPATNPSTPLDNHPFATPIRANPSTPLTRTSTSRTGSRRPLSDSQAMKQLVDCVGLSARKKVLETGRKPRILNSFSRAGVLKELRFPSSSASDGTLSEKSAAAALVPELEMSESDTDCPPSPSPRPGSALSISRRSATPTASGSYGQRIGNVRVPVDGRKPSRPETEVTGSGAEPQSRISLDDLETKHALLMQDILDLEQRLKGISVLVRV